MSALHNRTRTSASIPRKLLREGKLHLLPVYALMRTSDLAREGIENSGSYRFADTPQDPVILHLSKVMLDGEGPARD